MFYPSCLLCADLSFCLIQRMDRFTYWPVGRARDTPPRSRNYPSLSSSWSHLHLAGAATECSTPVRTTLHHHLYKNHSGLSQKFVIGLIKAARSQDQVRNGSAPDIVNVIYNRNITYIFYLNLFYLGHKSIFFYCRPENFRRIIISKVALLWVNRSENSELALGLKPENSCIQFVTLADTQR